MKLQEEAVASLETEAKLVLQWKTEHLKKLTERTYRALQSYRTKLIRSSVSRGEREAA